MTTLQHVQKVITENTTGSQLDIVLNADVYVYKAGGVILQPIFESRSGTAKANPFTVSDGLADFYIESGRFDIVVEPVGGGSEIARFDNFLVTREGIVGGIEGGAQFQTVADMVSGVAINLDKTVDFAALAAVNAKVSTVWNNSTSKAGGAEYIIKTAAQAAADGDVIDGDVSTFIGGNHYIGGGTAYVAILHHHGSVFTSQLGMLPTSNFYSVITKGLSIADTLIHDIDDVDMTNSTITSVTLPPSTNRASYCLLENYTDKQIIFNPGVKLLFDRAINPVPSLITWKNCTGCSVINPSCYSNGNRFSAGLSQMGTYQGAMIMFVDCFDCHTEKGLSDGAGYHTAFWSCDEHCYAEGGVAMVTAWGREAVPGDDDANKSPSAFLIYGSRAQVRNTTSFGGFWDGQISVFGSGSVGWKALNNKIFGYPYGIATDFSTFKLQQGLTIDQGPREGEATGNVIDGFFYGIDIKADTFQNNVHDNTVKRCKFPIAERKGEATGVNYSIQGKVHDNIVLLSAEPLQAPNASFELEGYIQIGYFTELRTSLDTCDNKILMDIKNNIGYGTIGVVKIAGVLVNQDTSQPSEYEPASKLQGNDVRLQTSLGATVYRAPANSAAYVLKSTLFLNMSGNTYELASSGTALHKALDLIGAAGTANRCSFKDLTGDLGSNNNTEVAFIDAKMMTNSLVVNFPEPNQNFETFNYKDSRVYETNGVIPSLSGVSTNDVVSIETGFDDLTYIRVYAAGEQSGGGRAIADCIIKMNVAGTALASKTITYTDNVNMTIDFLHTGATNTFKLQVNPTVGLTNASLTLEIRTTGTNIDVGNLF